MFLVFSVKNEMRQLQKDVVYRWGGGESLGWVILLSRENNDLEFPLFSVIILE